VTYVWAALCLLTWAWIAAGLVLRWRVERNVLKAYGALLNVKPGRWERNGAVRARMVKVVTGLSAPSPEARARWAAAMTRRPEDRPN
jgi:hypothetical protein